MQVRRFVPWALLAAGIGLSVASGLIPASDWINGILPVLALYFVGFLLIFPGLMAAFLYRISLRPTAARYTAWAARHWPIHAQRRFCAMQAANFYAQLDDPERAAEYADLGIRLNEPLLHLPRYRVLYAMSINVKGKLALDEGRYAEAFDAFHRPLRMNLEHRLYIPLFLSNCAAALYGLGKFAETLEYTQRAQAQNPPQQTAVTLLAHHNAALALIEMGRPAEALAESEKAVAVKAPRASQYHLMAEILHARLLALQDEVEASDALFTEVQSMIPTKNRALPQRLHTMRGIARCEAGRVEEATADLRLGLEGPSIAPACLYYLALIAEKQGDVAQAQEWCERLLREVPESFYTERMRQTQGMGMV